MHRTSEDKMLRALLRPSGTSPLLLLRRWEHSLAALPADWRKLTVPKLEVMDTSELKSLQELLAKEREVKEAEHAVAKAEQRKVLRVNCELDMKRIDKVNQLTEHVLKDSRREW